MRCEHLEDGGQLGLFVKDGYLFVACPQCRQTWAARLEEISRSSDIAMPEEVVAFAEADQ